MEAFRFGLPSGTAAGQKQGTSVSSWTEDRNTEGQQTDRKTEQGAT